LLVRVQPEEPIFSRSWRRPIRDLNNSEQFRSDAIRLSLLKTRSGTTGHRVAVVSKVEAEELGRSSEPKLTPVTLSPLTFI